MAPVFRSMASCDTNSTLVYMLNTPSCEDQNEEAGPGFAGRLRVL